MKFSIGSVLKVAAIAVCVIAGWAVGQTDITDKFPDEVFRAKVYSAIGKTAPAPILDSDVSGITYLDVQPNSLVSIISDLSGIEYFTALETLKCWNNKLTVLDVSSNIALTTLICDHNELTTLDVSKNTNLTYLGCHNNYLTALDVSSNTKLTDLSCNSNYNLSTLDISKNTRLRNLDCRYTKLTELDVSNNTGLTELVCGHNELTALDVSKNTALTYLNCFYNKLTALDVSQNTALTELNCSDNNLTTLDVSSNTKLKKLNVSNNYLTSEDKIIGLDKSITANFTFSPQKELNAVLLPASKKTSAVSFAGIKNGEINLNLNSGDYTAELYNLHGRLISSVNIRASNGVNATGLKTSRLSKGMFMLNVKRSSGAAVLKQKVKI